MSKTSLMLIDSKVLPEVFSKVLHAKKLLADGECKDISEAVKKAEISRSAFYKYRDYVFPFNQMQGIITLFFIVSDITGVLSSILSVLADAKTNVLTINQNIPVNSVADVTISVQNDISAVDLNELVDRLSSLDGVKDVRVLARQ
jgi:chorismate mutase